MKMQKGSAYPSETSNEYTGGMNQYSTPIAHISDANKPGPRPPYQPLKTTAASGNW
jgi:hypothetical protein